MIGFRVISDLHIYPPKSKASDSWDEDMLRSFVDDTYTRGLSLVINGDLFEGWHWRTFANIAKYYDRFLKSLSPDTVIIRGNHDQSRMGHAGTFLAQEYGLDTYTSYHDRALLPGGVLIEHGHKFDIRNSGKNTWRGWLVTKAVGIAEHVFPSIDTMYYTYRRMISARDANVHYWHDMVQESQRRGVKHGIIGHTHAAGTVTFDGVHIYNSGCALKSSNKFDYLECTDGVGKVESWI
jgi:metallophosphoesterase superfamily enzyme